MKISQWNAYIKKLREVNKKAYDEIFNWMLNHNVSQYESEYEFNKALIDYAYAIVTKYGEASSALACEFYDLLAQSQGAHVPRAVPALTASKRETAIAVSGAKMQGQAVVPHAVERLVKMAGQDTTLQNALRDGAEWAWIPSGDTCSFCITLASRGWQRASKKAIKGGHAEHIHANCDCAYAIRFNPFDDVEGYEPDKYLDMYNAESGSPEDKINAMRRKSYAENKDKINAQKREAYARRKQLEKEME